MSILLTGSVQSVTVHIRAKLTVSVFLLQCNLLACKKHAKEETRWRRVLMKDISVSHHPNETRKTTPPLRLMCTKHVVDHKQQHNIHSLHAAAYQ